MVQKIKICLDKLNQEALKYESKRKEAQDLLDTPQEVLTKADEQGSLKKAAEELLTKIQKLEPVKKEAVELLAKSYCATYNKMKYLSDVESIESFLKEMVSFASSYKKKLPKSIKDLIYQNLADAFFAIGRVSEGNKYLSKCNSDTWVWRLRLEAKKNDITTDGKESSEILLSLISKISTGVVDLDYKTIFEGNFFSGDDSMYIISSELLKSYLEWAISCSKYSEASQMLSKYRENFAASISVMSQDIKLEYLEFLIHSNNGNFQESNIKIQMLRDFYDPSGCYDHLVPLHLIQKCNKIHFFNCLDDGKISDAAECLEYLDESSFLELNNTLSKCKSRNLDEVSEVDDSTALEFEASSAQSDTQSDPQSDPESERYVSDILPQASGEISNDVVLRPVRVRERKEHTKALDINESNIKIIMEKPDITSKEWDACIKYLRNNACNEDPESWVIDGKEYDCEHGVINLHQIDGVCSNSYVYIDPKVLRKLDPSIKKQFLNAATKVVARGSGQNGLKPIQNGNVEIKIDGDLRLVASAKYKNLKGKTLIVFDSDAINHKSVSSLKTNLPSFEGIDIAARHKSLEEKIMAFRFYDYDSSEQPSDLHLKAPDDITDAAHEVEAAGVLPSGE